MSPLPIFYDHWFDTITPIKQNQANQGNQAKKTKNKKKHASVIFLPAKKKQHRIKHFCTYELETFRLESSGILNLMVLFSLKLLDVLKTKGRI